MDAPVFVGHPPCSIIFKNVVKLLFESLVVIPCLVFVSKSSSPFSMSPGVSDSDELQLLGCGDIKLSDVHYTVSVIELDSSWAAAFFFFVIFVFHGISAS
jgi:hypothetical protein